MTRVRTRVRFNGVSALSPLGAVLGAVVPSPVAQANYENAAHVPRQWKRTVLGSDLQWWDEAKPCSPMSSSSEKTADIFVDLFGNEPIGERQGRVWRVVDSNGEGILNPFWLQNACCRPPFVTSVFLIEGMPHEPEWIIIGEAHLSNRQRSRHLFNRIARAVAHLIASALRDADNPRGGSRRMHVSIRKRSQIEIAAAQLGAQVRQAGRIMRETVFSEYWAVGVLRAPAEILLRSQNLRPDTWIACDEDAYFADPFPLPGRPDVVLCERFDYRANCGRLRALTIAHEGAVEERSIDLKLDNRHLSYPCLFREGGRLFLLPEMASASELVLFEVLSDDAVRVVSVVDRGTRIADPTLFHHGGFYWIAYCDQDLGSDDNLCLLYALQPEGPWTHHPKNPVKVDIRSSRPGGTPFNVDGRLLRPAQDCSWTYGGAVVLNEIFICTPTDYAEREVAVLVPDTRGPFPHGLHTLSVGADRILLDGKKLFFDPRRAWKRIRGYARRHWPQEH